MMDNLRALLNGISDYLTMNKGPLIVGTITGGTAMLLIWVLVAFIA